MPRKETLDLLIEGGKASPGPNSAPKLAALKMNTGEIFKQINEKTKDYAGMQIPVKVEMNPAKKTFEIIVGTPPVSSLIKKELGIKLMKTAHMENIKKTEAGAAESGMAAAKPTETEKKEEAKHDGKKEEAKEGEEEKKDETPAPTGAPKPEKAAAEVLADIKMSQIVKIAKMKQPALFCKDLKGCVKQVVGTCATMPITVEGKKAKDAIKEIEAGKYDSVIQ